jgi:hypothetical protein
MNATENKSRYGEHLGYDVSVEPNDIPSHWKTHQRYSNGSKTHYDPDHESVVTDGDYSTIKSKNPDVMKRPEGREDKHLFRGMSHEEYQGALKNGYFESKGKYNLEGQEGITCYSKDRDQAANYASGFAPWHQKPTPTRPAVIVKIRDPGNHVHVPGCGESEVNIPGRISTRHLISTQFGHPTRIDTVSFEIRHHPYDGEKNKYQAGSSSGMSSSVRWTGEQKPKL